MNRKQLRAELAFVLNVAENEADQDFQASRLNKAIDRAYNLVLEDTKLNGGRDYFRGASANVTWAASTQQLSVPTALLDVVFEEVYDITGGEPGFPLRIVSSPEIQGDAFWYDRNTLQWSTSGGPSSARTLRVFYEAVAEELQDDDAEPSYVPAQFHWLIVWRAAMLLKAIADESVPLSWQKELESLQASFIKHVARGRPLSNYPRINQQRYAGDPVDF